MGLLDRAESKVGSWSTGMRQRLGLADALLREPRVLVLDEPTSGLDPAGVEDVHALIGALAAEGVAVLVSSHDMPEVAALCATVTVLAGGSVRFAGPLSSLRPSTGGGRYRLGTGSDDAALVVAQRLGIDVDRAVDGLHLVAEQSAVDSLVLALAGRRGIRARCDGMPPASR